MHVALIPPILHEKSSNKTMVEMNVSLLKDFSYTSGMSVCLSVCLPLWSIPITIGWIAMNFGTDIHVPHRINCNYFGDPLTVELNC